MVKFFDNNCSRKGGEKMEPKMEPIIDLIWSVEEDKDIDLNADHSIQANCGGCSNIACCCSVPSVITKWLCN